MVIVHIVEEDMMEVVGVVAKREKLRYVLS